MTRQELIEEITTAFERAEAVWLEDFDNSNVGTLVYYLCALRKVEREPFTKNNVHNEVMVFLQAKIDAAFDKIPREDLTQVFVEMERVNKRG